MRTSSYLSSARTSSLVMLVAVVVGYQLASSFARQASLILDARRSFATAYLQGRPDLLAGASNSVRIPGVGVMSVERRIDSTASATVRTADNRRWGTLIRTTEQPDTSVANEAARTLQQIAREVGVADPEDQDYLDNYVAIERPWSNRDVKVPGIDFGFRADVAPWVIVIAIVVLLIMIDSQLRVVLTDPDLALDEPWLVLDAREWLEKLVAMAWLLAVGFAPWLAGASVLLMLVGQIEASGLITPIWRHVFTFGVLIVILVTGGRVSLAVMSRLIHLRELRLARRQAGG